MKLDGVEIHESLTMERVEEGAREHMFGMENPGFCINCGEDADGCEPDAEKYRCHTCDNDTVYGAELLFLYMA